MLPLFHLAFSRRKRLVVITLLASIAAAGIEGVGLSLILPIVEGIGTQQVTQPAHPISRIIFDVFNTFGIPFSTIALVLVGLGLFALQSALMFTKTATTLAVRVGIEASLRSELFGGLLSARVSYFDDQRLGRLSNAIVVETTRVGNAILQLLGALVTALLVLAYLVVALLISWQLTLISIAILAVIAPIVLSTRRIRNRGRLITGANTAVESTAVEYLSAVREVNALGLQHHAIVLFNGLARNLGREIVLLEQTIASFKSVYELTAAAVIAVLLAMGSFVLHVPTAAIVAFFALLFRLAPRMVLLQTNVNQYAATAPAYEEIEELRQEIAANLSPPRGINVEIPFIHALALDEVSFSYNGRVQALDRVSFSIPHGTTVGIVGGSGAGKSTLIDLLLRFADPTGGVITVDGKDLREFDVESWRAKIGFVGQETFLFHATIEDNLRLGTPRASHDDVVAAAIAAGAHDFIKALPQGYGTAVGDRGAMLSGGQRQRLALARALLRHPDILLLDEATSDLDSRSQAVFREALQAMHGKRTIVLVAHRLSTIRYADRIIVLERGQVVESGTHDELLSSGGHYANYYATEAGGQAT